MKNSFLAYYKTILDKVSFDSTLFRKEYQKAVDTLAPEDSQQLNRWLKEKGLHTHLSTTKMQGRRGEVQRDYHNM